MYTSILLIKHRFNAEFAKDAKRDAEDWVWKRMDFPSWQNIESDKRVIHRMYAENLYFLCEISATSAFSALKFRLRPATVVSIVKLTGHYWDIFNSHHPIIAVYFE